jgi:hypothetical protein
LKRVALLRSKDLRGQQVNRDHRDHQVLREIMAM